jgi:tRNA uridine 5-carboxymethylaminomethyl modification enzyme
VLIDDLVTKGTAEPYRMFTSRAEYRLLLRQDNADARLSELAHEIGLLPERHYRAWTKKKAAVEAEIIRLQSTRIGTDTLAQMLKRPEVTYPALPSRNDQLTAEEMQQVEIGIKYVGYISRQETEVARFKQLEDKEIPLTFDYQAVNGLRREARQKLGQIRPRTLGQASRISGVTPADVSVLMVWLKRGAASENVTVEEEETR